MLTTAPVLAFPRFDRVFLLDVDASLRALGASLSQEGDDGLRRPIVYASRALKGLEQKYPDYSSFSLV